MKRFPLLDEPEPTNQTHLVFWSCRENFPHQTKNMATATVCQSLTLQGVEDAVLRMIQPLGGASSDAPPHQAACSLFFFFLKLTVKRPEVKCQVFTFILKICITSISGSTCLSHL